MIKDFGRTFQTKEEWEAWLKEGCDKFGDVFLEMRDKSNREDANKMHKPYQLEQEAKARYGDLFDYMHSKTIEQSKEDFDHEILWRDAIRDAEKAEEAKQRRLGNNKC